MKRLHTLLKHADFISAFLVFIFAFSIRLVFLEQIKGCPFFIPHSLDPLFYHNWAIKISSGDWLGNSVFKGLPLYAYFLALIYKIFGINVYIAKFIQIIMGSVSCVMLYFLGKNIFNRKIAILSSLLAVFYKPFIFYDCELIGTCLEIFLYLIVLLVSLKFIKTFSLPSGFIFGILTGISSLCRPSILLYPFIVFLGFLFKFRKNLKKEFLIGFILCFIGCGIILGISGLRNYLVGKDFVILTAHSGINFYIGNNKDASGKMHSIKGIGRQGEQMIENSHRLAEKESGKKLKQSESSKFWKNKAYNYIFHNPFKYILLQFKKTYLFWQGGEIPDFVNIEFYERFSSLIRIPMISFFLIVPWAIFGILFSLKENSGKSVLRYFIFCQFISVILYFVNSRYRLPVVPALILFSSHGIFIVLNSLRNWKRLVTYLFIVSIIYVAVSWNMEKPQLSDDYNKLASWYLSEKKDVKKGLELLQRAYLLDPHNEYVIYNLARLYFDTNKFDLSLEFFQKCLSLDKNDFESLNFIGIIYSKIGNQNNALIFFQKALNINSQYYLALNNMAACYKFLNKLDKAAQCYKISLRINPNQPGVKKELDKLYRF